MIDNRFFEKLSSFIDNKIKEALSNLIDIYQVVSYDENTGKVKMRKIYEKNDVLIEILDSGQGFGDKKTISIGYSPGDILVVLEIKGTKIILTSLFNDFFKEKDRKLIPNKNEMILKSASGFKLLNDEGFGITCDEFGNITIRGLTINHTQTPEELNYIE